MFPPEGMGLFKIIIAESGDGRIRKAVKRGYGKAAKRGYGRWQSGKKAMWEDKMICHCEERSLRRGNLRASGSA
jgi:hypothetical protein